MSKETFLSTSNVVKSLGGRGTTPDPTGEANSAPPDLLAAPKYPTSLRASNLVAFGHSSRP